MQVSLPGGPHLTYCTNIHPGETLAEVRRIVEVHVPRVRDLVGYEGPFGVGLRLAGRAAEELSMPGAAASLRSLLEEQGAYCFTVNGFPFGTFHGQRVKEDVYRPDWLEPERGVYTERLAAALAVLLPEGVTGSISTVPGVFRARMSAGAARDMALALARQVAFLHHLRESTGKVVALCLEPEPECFLETTADAVAFFREHGHGADAEREVVRLTGLGSSAAGDKLREHLGLCLDACHLAVEYEDPRVAVGALSEAGIRIGKIQITTALRLDLTGDPGRDAAKLDALQRFDDGVYLHQVVEQGESGGLRRFLDLPDALAAARRDSGSGPRQWRIHFHVPVFREQAEPFATTQPSLRELLTLIREEPLSPHLEVETYTWGVLPAELRGMPVEEAIARELTWTLGELGVRPRHD